MQVKTRNAALTHADIKSGLERFDALRTEHAEGRRTGRAATFVIAANVTPGPALMGTSKAAAWPADVAIHWPGCGLIDPALPEPQPDLARALSQCTALSATLPFALLAPDTLVWKLASMVMAASAGNPPRPDHRFSVEELSGLFEQLVVQLQDFPAPPPLYRTQENEPALQTGQRVRMIVGYSGAGKTAWVSQAASHALGTVAYYEIVETPGPALATSLARELAARLFGKSETLGEILLPGATGSAGYWRPCRGRG